MQFLSLSFSLLFAAIPVFRVHHHRLSVCFSFLSARFLPLRAPFLLSLQPEIIYVVIYG